MFTILRALLKTMRPKQWLTKNIFIFAAVVFDSKLFVPGPFFQTPLGKTIIGFVLLCLISSTIYIINDLADIEADRQHPKKKFRPIPSGLLPIPVAVGAAIVIGLGTLIGSFALNTTFGLIVVIYALINLAYSFKLKHIVIVDVLIVAAGFVLRVAAGVPLVQVVRFSPWLYVCMALLALFLGIAKRRQEIMLLKNGAVNARAILNEYNLEFLDGMLNVIMATTILAYSMYTFLAEGLPPNHTMMLTIPFVLYGIFRYLYLVHVRGEIAPPDEVALKDRPLQIDLALWALSVVVFLYVIPR
ncbi:MAG: decaprenyl-phosphate phosphoribosyltransferase [Thermoflexales bacterium]|nr:decaprenyl-phosphate phosphoribosyltransferase [Thermoflexales bacterium]